MLRWAIVGTGDISERVVSDLLAVAPGSVSAVWGRTPERAAAFASVNGIPVATASWTDLVERDDVDIVYIATPATTHRDFAVEALAAGKHVLVEKPMATSADDVAAIFDAAKAAGRFAMEAMWMRFNPLHIDVRDRIADGLLGDVHAVRASFGTPFMPRGTKLTPAQGGSILLDRGIYPITLAHWFLGEPNVVEATGTLADGVDVEGSATLASAAGFAQLAWSGVRFLDLSASVAGERGWVTLDPMFWAGTRARVHAGSVQHIFGDPEIIEHPREGNGYRPMLAAVIRAVDEGALEHPWHDATATIAVARSMDAVLAAIVQSP